MRTEKLDKCLDYIENWETLNAADHRKCYSKGPLNSLALVEPFKKELLENLIDLDHKQQVNLIGYYIMEIYKTANTDYIRYLHDFYVKDENGAPKDTQIVNLYDEEDPDAFEIIRFLWWLFIEIDYCCSIYKIPLDKLIEDQGIDLHVFFFEPPITISEITIDISLPDIRPIVSSEYIHEIFDILKNFFNESDRPEFFKLLQTGRNTKKPIMFLDAGNRLADAFKQLYDSDIITGCQKRDLEYWISKNFTYLSKNKIKKYTVRYLNEIISTRKDMCQKPILNLYNDKEMGKYLISKI